MKNTDAHSRFIEVPLADELFECLQGDFRNSVQIFSDDPNVEPAQYRYHTYVSVAVGSLDDSKVETTLRLAFETHLRTLRENCLPPGIDWPANQTYKPKLYWRFRKGSHIQLESNMSKRDPKVKLYTRLVVPACTLEMCPHCYRTEGEPHATHCDNVVRTYHAKMP